MYEELSTRQVVGANSTSTLIIIFKNEPISVTSFVELMKKFQENSRKHKEITQNELVFTSILLVLSDVHLNEFHLEHLKKLLNYWKSTSSDQKLVFLSGSSAQQALHQTFSKAISEYLNKGYEVETFFSLKDAFCFINSIDPQVEFNEKNRLRFGRFITMVISMNKLLK